MDRRIWNHHEDVRRFPTLEAVTGSTLMSKIQVFHVLECLPAAAISWRSYDAQKLLQKINIVHLKWKKTIGKCLDFNVDRFILNASQIKRTLSQCTIYLCLNVLQDDINQGLPYQQNCSYNEQL